MRIQTVCWMPCLLALLFPSLAGANSPTEPNPSPDQSRIQFKFEGMDKDTWPEGWHRAEGVSLRSEDGNFFLRLHHPENDQRIRTERRVPVPRDAEAMELTWRQRVTRTVEGPRPYFSARMKVIYVNAEGKETKWNRCPDPVDTTEPTEGWREERIRFPLPDHAVELILRATLWTPMAARFDLDDLALREVDAGPILAERDRKRARIEQAKSVPPEDPEPDHWPPEVRVEGNRLVDHAGNEVWLQGMNAGGLDGIPSDEQPLRSVVTGIEEWGANCVRLPVKEHFWFGEGPHQNDGGKGYRELVDRAVTLAANRGAYLVIDLHRFRAPKQEHADFWRSCAARYKNHPAVLFDLFNEPHGISWEVWRNGGFVGEEGSRDESEFLSEEEKRKNRGFESVGMQALVDAVRSTGARNIVIAGGIWWCNDLRGVVNGYALDDPTGNGVMYAWHTYHWHSDWAERVLPAAEKYPIFLGEVGAEVTPFSFIPEEEPQENPYTWVPDMLGFIQKYRLNWTAWCFHPVYAPVMVSDWEYTPTPYWGRFVKRALAGETFELKRMR